MGVLRLLGPDQSTLLFDFTAPTGTGNPSSVVTKLGAELDLGTISPTLDLDPRTYGVDLIGNSTPPVEMTIPFTASAATDDALWAGLGQLDRYLLSIARDHPLYLEWTELTSTLYYDVIGATSLVQLLRGQTAAGQVASRKSSLGEIPLRLLRQPWARGASVTTSGVTVPNDPATGTKVRVLPVTVTGDLPTPGRVVVKMTGSDKTLSTSAAADDIVDVVGHGFEINDPVMFTALTGGTGLSINTVYYVITSNYGADTFQIAVNPGGSVLGWSTDITAGTVTLAPTVERVLISHRAEKSNPVSQFADYLTDTGFLQCEATGRGWTVTLTNDTAGASATTASPGSGTSAARCQYTSDPTVYKKRVRATRTTKLDSIRGSWTVWARVRHEPSASAGAEHRIQLRWGAGLPDPAPITNPEVTFDTTPIAGGNENYKWVELNLGTIQLPQSVPLSGLVLELWSRRVSGTGSILFDFLWLCPSTHATAVLPPGGTTDWVASELTSPVTSPGGGTAGTLNAAGSRLLLDNTTDNAGVPPNAGQVLAAGRYRSTFRLHNSSTSAVTVQLNVRDVTDGNYAGQVIPTINQMGHVTYRVLWDVTAGNVGDAFQEQVDDPSVASVIRVVSISREYISTAYKDESIRTEPGPNRYGVDKLDSAGNYAGSLSIEGEVPVLLQPGNNHLFIRCDENNAILHYENENKLARTPTVNVVYDPRYAI